jgi:hypothetical protein
MSTSFVRYRGKGFWSWDGYLATFPLKIPKAGTGTLAEASRLFHGVVARRGKRKQKLIRDRFGVGVEGRER